MPSFTSLTPMLCGIVLGACATAAVTSVAEPAPAPSSAAATDTTTRGRPAATVIALNDAPRQVAPSGKVRITHLARGENAYVGKLEMDADGAVPEHRDPTEEFIHVLSGGGTITIDGTAQSIKAGATIYMPANALVSYQNGSEPMVALQVFAGPEPAAKYEGWNADS